MSLKLLVMFFFCKVIALFTSLQDLNFIGYVIFAKFALFCIYYVVQSTVIAKFHLKIIALKLHKSLQNIYCIIAYL